MIPYPLKGRVFYVDTTDSGGLAYCMVYSEIWTAHSQVGTNHRIVNIDSPSLCLEEEVMNKEELMEMVIEYLKEHVDTNDDRLEGVITEEFYHEVKETVEDFVQQLNLSLIHI